MKVLLNILVLITIFQLVCSLTVSIGHKNKEMVSYVPHRYHKFKLDFLIWSSVPGLLLTNIKIEVFLVPSGMYKWSMVPTCAFKVGIRSRIKHLSPWQWGNWLPIFELVINFPTVTILLTNLKTVNDFPAMEILDRNWNFGPKLRTVSEISHQFPLRQGLRYSIQEALLVFLSNPGVDEGWFSFLEIFARLAYSESIG